MRFNNIYLYFLIIVFLPILGQLIKSIYSYYKLYKEYKTNTSLYKLTHRLTPREFEVWCSEYLISLGFSNIVLLSLDPDSGKDLICTKDNLNYYVECKKFSQDNLIEPSHLERLLGAMIADNISNGILITTSKLSNEAESFLKELDSRFNITTITSENFQCSYSDYILKSN